MNGNRTWKTALASPCTKFALSCLLAVSPALVQAMEPVKIPHGTPYKTYLEQLVTDYMREAPVGEAAYGIVPMLVDELQKEVGSLPSIPLRAPVEAGRVMSISLHDYKDLWEVVVIELSGRGIVPFSRKAPLVRFLADPEPPVEYAKLREQAVSILAMHLFSVDRYAKMGAQSIIMESGLEPVWIRELVALSILDEVFSKERHAFDVDQKKLISMILEMAKTAAVRELIWSRFGGMKSPSIAFATSDVRQTFDMTAYSEMRSLLTDHMCAILLRK
jgi:hypothetical protein